MFPTGTLPRKVMLPAQPLTTKGDLAEDSRVAFSSDGDIITVGNFAKEADVTITSAGNLFIASCHQKY